MRAARVVVVGSSNTDMVVKMPRIPAPGETMLGGDFFMVAGGKGANQVVACARLGADTTFIARVGSDVFGDRAIATIGAAGVHTNYIARDAEAPSGVALILVDAQGQNAIGVAPGANMRLTPEDVRAALPAIEAADVVVLQLEIPLETVSCAIGLAKEREKIVILNPAPAAKVPEGFLRGVDVLTPNAVEAAMLVGRECDGSVDCAQAARALLEEGVGAVVVTLGEKGALAATPDRIQEIPPRRVKAVDTTAAGDCFTGALACALGEGRELGQAVYFANAAAALSVTRMGAQTSIPTRQEVEAFIARR
jgi:ribokinase